MRNTILTIAALAVPFTGFTQESVEPVMKEGMYVLKISPNGNWFGSMAGDASVYNLKTGENVFHDGCYLGLGNCVANNGIAVGDANDVAVIMINGETLYPESIGGEKYWFCDVNAITPDATRIVGQFNNLDKNSEIQYIPFVAPIDANGNVGEPINLPYPEKDLLGGNPTYVTAVWISYDGKTIAGQVIDWTGHYTYPIIYHETSPGKWDYTLPSESLFNPDKVVLGDNPYWTEPTYPNPADFMSGVKKEQYEKYYEDYMNGNSIYYPDPKEFMDDAQWAKYQAADAKYEEWVDANIDAIRAYDLKFTEVLTASPSFVLNDFTLSPDGKILMSRGGVARLNEDDESLIFSFDLASGAIERITPPDPLFYPSQILENGTLVITKGQDYVPTTCLMLPGSDKFITMQEYFQANHPEISEWLDENVPGGTGVVSINDAMTVFSGGLIPDQRSDYNENDYYYYTYFIQLENAGIEKIEAQETSGEEVIYNLQGLRVKKENTVPGIYIINGKKVMVK